MVRTGPNYTGEGITSQLIEAGTGPFPFIPPATNPVHASPTRAMKSARPSGHQAVHPAEAPHDEEMPM